MKLIIGQRNSKSSRKSLRTAAKGNAETADKKISWLKNWLDISVFQENNLLDKVSALLHRLDAKDIETMSHARRVAAFSVRLAIELDVPQSSLASLWLGSLLHDIGKIMVPDRILKKAGKLNQDEWAVMRRHSENGKQVLVKLGFSEDVWAIAESHHERFDGTGYPNGLRGTEIPLSARIFSAVDTFDAITSERCYRQKQSAHFAYDEIAKVSGSQLDPTIVDCFLKIHPAEWNETLINENFYLKPRLEAA